MTEREEEEKEDERKRGGRKVMRWDEMRDMR
jgi:hypothetical protein